MAYELIETIEVTNATTTDLVFTSIPQDGVDLKLVVSARNSDSAPGVVLITLNNDSGSNYSQEDLEGNGGSVSSNSSTQGYFRLRMTDSGDTANTFGSGQAYISNYTSSSNKSISCDRVTENNASTAYQRIEAVSYSTSSAISSIEIDFLGDNFAQYTTASLYKIY